MDFLDEILKSDLPAPQTWVRAAANTNTTNQLVTTIDVSQRSNNDVTQDSTESRDTIRTLIAQGLGAVNDLSVLAKTTSTPRAFEVLANMLKTVSELNHDLMKIHADEQALTVGTPEAEDQISGDIHIDKAVFIGSTTDLANVVKQKKAELHNGDSSTITIEAQKEE